MMKDTWDALDTKYGRKDDVALHFIDKFKNLEVTGQSDHHKFVKFYEVFKSTKFNLEEIHRLNVLKESHSM